MQNLRPRPLHAQIHFQLLPYGASNAMNSGPGRVELGSQNANQSQLFFYYEYQNIFSPKTNFQYHYEKKIE